MQLSLPSPSHFCTNSHTLLARHRQLNEPFSPWGPRLSRLSRALQNSAQARQTNSLSSLFLTPLSFFHCKKKPLLRSALQCKSCKGYFIQGRIEVFFLLLTILFFSICRVSSRETKILDANDLFCELHEILCAKETLKWMQKYGGCGSLPRTHANNNNNDAVPYYFDSRMVRQFYVLL